MASVIVASVTVSFKLAKIQGSLLCTAASSRWHMSNVEADYTSEAFVAEVSLLSPQ